MEFACKAVIFDFDGVLINSDPISVRYWIWWARRHGLAEEKILSIHHGLPTVETMRAVAPDLDVEAEALALETKGADDIDGLKTYPGALELTSALPGNAWGIATSARRRTAKKRLRYLGFTQPSVLITADDVKRGKPDPEPYRLAAASLGFATEECLVLEDAPAGIASAKAAGTQVVAIASTNGARALRQADAIIESLSILRVQIRAKNELIVCI